MLKKTFLTVIALFIALLVSNFQPTNSTPVLGMLSRIGNGIGLTKNQQPGLVGQTGNNLNVEQTGIHPIQTPSIFLQSIEPQICSICEDKQVSQTCYFNCDKSSNHPKGHLFCDECILKLSKNTPVVCPNCRKGGNEAKIKQLESKKQGQKNWEKGLILIRKSGIILPEQFNPSGVILPVNYGLRMEKFLFDLVFSGIPLNNITIKNMIRNIIHAVLLTKSNDDFSKNDMIIDIIRNCILHSNGIIFLDIFSNLQPVHRYHLAVKAIEYSYMVYKTPLLVPLIPTFTEDRIIRLVQHCIDQAISSRYYGNVFDIIRNAYPNNKDNLNKYNLYKYWMKYLIRGSSADPSNYLTPQEKVKFMKYRRNS